MVNEVRMRGPDAGFTQGLVVSLANLHPQTSWHHGPHCIVPMLRALAPSICMLGGSATGPSGSYDLYLCMATYFSCGHNRRQMVREGRDRRGKAKSGQEGGKAESIEVRRAGEEAEWDLNE